MSGSKANLVRFFKTKIGGTVYYSPFCKLWEEVVSHKELDLEDCKQKNTFSHFLHKIKHRTLNEDHDDQEPEEEEPTSS